MPFQREEVPVEVRVQVQVGWEVAVEGDRAASERAREDGRRGQD